MSVPTVVTNISNMLTDIIDAGETVIDQAVIDDVKLKLHTAAEGMERTRFADTVTDVNSFGDTSAAANLGYHHSKAHQVMTDTLQGVLEDLARFRTGIVKAEALIGQADEDSAVSFNKKAERAAAVLTASSSHSHGDRRNHDSRNEHLPSGGADA